MFSLNPVPLVLSKSSPSVIVLGPRSDHCRAVWTSLSELSMVLPYAFVMPGAITSEHGPA